jgi:hypothetical protein
VLSKFRLARDVGAFDLGETSVSVSNSDFDRVQNGKDTTRGGIEVESYELLQLLDRDSRDIGGNTDVIAKVVDSLRRITTTAKSNNSGQAGIVPTPNVI